AVSAGGVLLGAFDEHGVLVGFCYGFIGLRDRELLFYSHMAGVRPGLQDRDIGFLLKRAQRQAALDRGLDRMVWTFDPLQSLNASFNLRKLGVTASRYYVDYYGEMPDAINRGVPSDRLEVDWWLRDPAVEARLTGDASPRSWPDAPAALVGIRRGDTLAPDIAPDLDQPVVRVEVPTTFGDIKTRAPELALSWRMASREVFPFETSFGRQDKHSCLLIRLGTNGLEGWGEVPVETAPLYNEETTGTAWHMLEQFILPLLMGREIAHPKEFPPLVRHLRRHHMAKAGVEAALWDLHSQQHEIPLAKALGGTRPVIEVGVSLGIEPSVDALLARIHDFLGRGYRRIKIKIKPGWDVQVVREVRRAFGA